MQRSRVCARLKLNWPIFHVSRRSGGRVRNRKQREEVCYHWQEYRAIKLMRKEKRADEGEKETREEEGLSPNGLRNVLVGPRHAPFMVTLSETRATIFIDSPKRVSFFFFIKVSGALTLRHRCEAWVRSSTRMSTLKFSDALVILLPSLGILERKIRVID